VGLITEQTFELEVCVELTRDHGWGRHVFEQKKALAAAVERILKEAEKQVDQALPMPPSGFGRARKPAPRFDGPPEARAVARANTALAFAHEVRPFAGHGGFSASHAKAMEALGATIDEYVEDAVDICRSGLAEPALVSAYLAAAAEFMGAIRDRQAAELIRRRAASAKPTEPPKEAARG
jgi:hypothetical protein